MNSEDFREVSVAEFITVRFQRNCGYGFNIDVMFQ